MAFTCRVQYLDDTDPFASTVFPEPTRPPSFTFNEYLPLIDQLPAVSKFLRAPHKLEDCTLQLSHNGYYLDIESSIDEQKDDFEGFNKERKHSVILRSQLSVRVHACIEKLLNSTGRELRRALFSLKQIFQDDKDLVHEFVSADGLACLIKVGTDADQNYQNYILRALGQIMLYVDGMNGVIEHTDTVQWLYSLLSSKYRLVVKTSLKLLLVFVEYTETNATVLYQATCVVDKEQGKQTWSSVMNLLKDEGQDSEILVYTMSLINKTLNAIPDQDTFYDITDSLEQQRIEETTKQLMSGKGTDLDLVEQFKLYEYSLKKEDGDIDIPVERKHNLRKHRRSAETADRKSLRRSLKPTAEYGGDRRELRRSLDLGKELTPQDADRVHDSNRRRDNRRVRPRVSLDNSSLSSEVTVKEQLEERKARLRVPDRDGSSREDTSAGTTDFSASENSSTKIPWRRGRIRQASAPGDVANAIPQPNELRPVPASTEESARSSEPSNVPTRQDTSPARQPTYDAPSSRTRPSSDTTTTTPTRRKPAVEDDTTTTTPARRKPAIEDDTTTTTTPARRKPAVEDDTTSTPRSRSRPSTDDTPSRVKPTEEDTTPRRRRYRPESIPESPSVSDPAVTPTKTTTPSSPSETDYITERRKRRREREAQRAAEAAAAEAAEKQTATLPRNFKPADITPPLTTTEYVSHRRRRNKEGVHEETVSTTITSRPAEVSSPVENGDLSGGIAARRKLRQEQREREQKEKERLEKEQREKERAEKAKDEKKDSVKRPVPIIREPTPSTSEQDEKKDEQGQRSSSPASRSKVIGLSNGDSSGLEAISPQVSRTASPERDRVMDDSVFEKTPKPSSETNHVEPTSKKTEPAKEISEKPSSKENKEPVKLTVDTKAMPDEDKVKGSEAPMSAGLSNNKRYQLAMMYSNRNSQDETTVSSPTRKVSTSLQSNETISNRIDQLRNGPVKDEECDQESAKTPKEIEVTPGKVQAAQEKLQSPGPLSGEKEKFAGPTGDKSGAIGLAKHGLKSVNIPMKQPTAPVNKPETPEEREDAQWEEILRQNNRELRVNNWDFTDLTNQDDQNVFLIKSMCEVEGFVPAPPPLPMGGGMPPPPPAPPMMPPGHYGTLPPPPPPLSGTSITDGYNTYPPKKKKTVRLFWKETRLDRLAMYGKKDPKETIWGTLGDVTIDKRKLEHLFESKAKEILQKKILEAGKKHVISVLDPKRSNHINIALTALPHPSTIKQAIMKMDGTAVNKEGIEKLLTMVPSEEESNLIKESMILNPDIPLGSAEQFLYMLSNVTVLKARLSLWLFKMDYESMEEEVAEPLAELKKGIEDLKTNETFRHILSMLLAVGNFLNGAQIQGFHIDYLAKVPDIKDTVHKQSLLYHLCTMVIEQFPESTDLFSELASISRCAKVDFEVLETNLQKMEEHCTSSWEHLRVISKHDSHSPLKNRLQDFLSDCAQRIIVLKIVHKRVMNRFNQLLLYLGMTASSARETKKTEFCKIISEFALEYRTTRERVLEQEKKKANHRKRAMTRGKMITENLTLSQDKEEDAKLKALLKNHVGTAPGDETLKTRTRQKPTLGHSTANMEDVGDEQTDEMLQILVNTAKNTKTRNTPRERKRGRTNRKSLRRTLKGGTGLTEAESRALGLHPACKAGVQV